MPATGNTLSTIALCTLAQAKQTVGIPSSETSADQILIRLINRVSRRMIERAQRELKTEFGSGSPPDGVGARTFPIIGDGLDALVLFTPYDLQAISSVVLFADQPTSVTLDSTQYQLEPLGKEHGVWEELVITGQAVPLRAGRPTDREQLCTITGTWGFPTVPDEIVEWCCDTVKEWFDRQASDRLDSIPSDNSVESYGSSPGTPLWLPIHVRQGLDETYRRASI